MIFKKSTYIKLMDPLINNMFYLIFALINQNISTPIYKEHTKLILLIVVTNRFKTNSTAKQ